MDISTTGKDMGLEIARLRQRKEMSQDKLAEKSGVSKSQIHRIECGRVKNIGISTLSKLATALEVLPEDIMKDGGGEGKYHYNAASGRQTDLCPSGILFGKVRCDKAREHRLHAACAKGEHQCVEWCGELVDTKGFRTDPARQEYSIEKSKNSADDPGRGQDQCAKKKRVLSCDFQHGIDSFHGIAQIV